MSDAQAVALHLEGYKTYSEVERAVMGRYFFFQLANVFVTIGAGSIKDVSQVVGLASSIGAVVCFTVMESMPCITINRNRAVIVNSMMYGLARKSRSHPFLCFRGRHMSRSTIGHAPKCPYIHVARRILSLQYIFIIYSCRELSADCNSGGHY